MLLFDAPLTLREYMSREEVPLAVIFREVFTFISGRPDVIVFGAHAVNAYVEPERMTQDVDLLSRRARELADELREHLGTRLTIAARVREVVPNTGFRIYQLRTPKNRHLVDIRQAESLPACQEIEGIQVVAPVDLLAMKIVSAASRRGAEKGLSDRLDAHRLLKAFPELRTEEGAVRAQLATMGADAAAIEMWRELLVQKLIDDEDEEG